MPYIKSDDGRREALNNGDTALTAGELNYQIFYYLKYHNSRLSLNDKIEHIRYFVNNFLGGKRNYQKYNDMRGCLISCYKECQRRLGINPTFLCDIMESYDEEINTYEDIKIDENGDVL